jgi:hypothetical protein
LKFFDGWQLVEPGLVPKHKWRPDSGAAASLFDIAYGGVARKS